MGVEKLSLAVVSRLELVSSEEGFSIRGAI